MKLSFLRSRPGSLLLWCMLYMCLQSVAQGENNNWVFGNNAFVSFNSGSPQSFTCNIFATEGSAAVSNSYGALLFYSDGRSVWDASYNLMPNGGGLTGNQLTSASQGVLIVQFPDNRNRYYLFVLDALLNTGLAGYTNGSLRYSVVDMSLNGGMGDVLPGQKNILVGTGYSEQMTITPGPACNSAWLVVRDTISSIHSYLIDPAGIGAAPVVSSYPPVPGAGRIGEMKLSHNGRLLAWASQPGGFVQVGNFDPLTGVAGNFQVMTGQGWQPYGIAFSPGDTRLYVAYSTAVKQYDLSLLPNTGAFAASAYEVAAGGIYSFMSLREAPGGQLYFNRNSNNPLYAIRYPDLAGAACSVDTAALYCTGATRPLIGLGADAYIFPVKDTFPGHTTDTLACFAGSLRLEAPQGFNRYQWSHGGTTAVTTVNAAGTYWVRLEDDTACTVRTDTFRVQLEQFVVHLGADTAFCPGDSLTLDAGVAEARYLWQDGSTQQTLRAGAAGWYSVQVSRNGCTAAGSRQLESISHYLDILQQDTVICRGTALSLAVRTDMPGSLRWNTGHNGESYTVNEPGLYQVTATGRCGSLSDDVQVDMRRCDCIPFIPNAFSPNGDGLNDGFRAEVACTPAHFRLQVFNRYGQQVFEAFQKDRGWDGTFHGRPADGGTYFYVLQLWDKEGKEQVRRGDLQLLR